MGNEEGISRRTFLKAGIGLAGGVLAAVGAARFPKGEESPVGVAPTAVRVASEPSATPGLLASPTAIDKPRQTPTAANPTRLEMPTVKPTDIIPISAPLPSPAETKSTSIAGVEIASSLTVGNVTLAVSKEVANRRSCKSPSDIECGAVEGFELNTSKFPDAKDRLQRGTNLGLYYAWQTEPGHTERANVSFDQFIQKLADGDDLSFKIKAYEKDQELLVDPRKAVIFVAINDSSPDTAAIVRPESITIQRGEIVKYGVKNGGLAIYYIHTTGFSIDDPVRKNYMVSRSMVTSLTRLSDRVSQKNGMVNYRDRDNEAALAAISTKLNAVFFSTHTEKINNEDVKIADGIILPVKA